jgi:hypothetical protein
LTFRDGDELVADQDFVLEEEDCTVIDFVRSNRPDMDERSDKRPILRKKHAPGPRQSGPGRYGAKLSFPFVRT